MTAKQYAKQEMQNGRFASMLIVAGEFGTFWLETAEYKTLDGACFQSREAAEKARSKAIDYGRKFIAA